MKKIIPLLCGLAFLMGCSLKYKETTTETLLLNPAKYDFRKVAVTGNITPSHYPYNYILEEGKCKIPLSLNYDLFSQFFKAKQINKAIKKEANDKDEEKVKVFGSYQSNIGVIHTDAIEIEGKQYLLNIFVRPKNKY